MSSDPARDDWMETYKSLVSLATEGFKFCALANGGAAVAILAYLGNVAGKGGTAPDMRTPMAAFLSGLVFCGLAMIVAYWNQLNRLNRVLRREGPEQGLACEGRRSFGHCQSYVIRVWLVVACGVIQVNSPPSNQIEWTGMRPSRCALWPLAAQLGRWT